MTRVDPIFKLETPLLFAHRGGVWEAPESTVKAFRHAIENAKTDILELDVQLTRDGEFVVWHGPDLDNVRIKRQPDNPTQRQRRKIYHYDWDELQDSAWVADPEIKRLEPEDRDLGLVDNLDAERCLLLLSDFLAKFPDIPLNIEMKKSFKRKIDDGKRKGLKDNLKAFIDILEKDPRDRTKVIVSAVDDYIDEFRELSQERYPTGLSAKEQLILKIFGNDMSNRALETSYSRLLSGKDTIEKVRASGGATYVFLTEFTLLLPAIDKEIPSDEDIFEILDRGVDGIMTDRPKAVREIMKRWAANKD